MAIYIERNSKVTIPNYAPFSMEYKGAKFTLSQELHYEGGNIYIHIPNTIYCRTPEGLQRLDDSCQKNGYDLSEIKPEGVLICDLHRQNNGLFVVVPNPKTTLFVQSRLRQGKSVSLRDMCFQYSDHYTAFETETIICSTRIEHLNGVNSWLSGDHYQVEPTCEKWEHIRSYTGDPLQECIFQIQHQVDNPPEYMDIDKHLQSFDDAISKQDMSSKDKDILRSAHSDFVKYHNNFVDRWRSM